MADVRDHLAAGRYVAAGEMLRATQGADAEALQPVGDVQIEFIGSLAAMGTYRRSLSLRDGVARVERVVDGHHVWHEVLASAEHQVVAVRLETDSPEGLHLRLRLSTPQPRAEQRAVGGRLGLVLAAPRHVVPWPRDDGVSYEDDELTSIRAAAVLSADAEGADARIRCVDGALAVGGASAVTVLVAVRTGFDRWDSPPTRSGDQCLDVAAMDIDRAGTLGWQAVRDAHVDGHRALMDRVTLSLGNSASGIDLPTDVRLTRRAEGTPDEDLRVLAFMFGRYLLAASSRPGTEPATLQGVWNSEIAPPWNSQYTLNINAEMNYWPAETTALPECHEPLLRLAQDLAQAGRPAARRIYGARGWTAHHNTDLWRVAVPVGKGLGDPMWAQWPMGGVWLSMHLAERWRFGRDQEFLADVALPVCLDAARFVLDLLVEDAEGTLVTSPSTSPENRFLTDDGPACVVAGSAMDLTLARELFGFVLEAADRLTSAGVRVSAEDAAALEEVRSALPRLAPLRTGSDGRLLEWPTEFEESEPHHRHVSHLVGLYPGRSGASDPDFRAAARRSLIGRGDAGTGWSLAWKVGLWARLGDGAAAHRLLGEYLRPVMPSVSDDPFATRGGVYRSLLCAHPPFQIDGNFGVTAAVAEMLLQSHDTRNGVPVVELLPALPPQWPDGRVTGLRARGALRVAELVWSGGVVESAIVEALADTRVELRWRDREGVVHHRVCDLAAGGRASVLGRPGKSP